MKLSAFFAGFQEVAADLEDLGVDTEPLITAINPAAGAVEGGVLGFIALAGKIATLFGAQAVANQPAPAPTVAAAPAPAPAPASTVNSTDAGSQTEASTVSTVAAASSELSGLAPA